ncbi:fumarylacetoacetate hydrolase family protein [Piscibacillus sp. B03]|uniref:fumarylacetoacetate hydrolase family protein n=1 Tax=Piscibacillus sp. B03 TaxID=3457430 RepID=UPI003FCED8C3
MSRIKFKLQGFSQIKEGELDLTNQLVKLHGQDYSVDQLTFDNPISDTLYGTILNYKGEYDLLKPEMDEKPYQKPPEAPILYIKPVNTFSSHQSPIPLPEGEEQVQIGAALGLVIGQTATKVKQEDAFDYIEGYTVVNDVSLPIENVYRPAIKQKSRDGFCPIGPWIIERDQVKDPHQLSTKVWINGELKQENSTRNLIRTIPELIADVTEFMTLYEGDVLLVGVPENPPYARIGDRVKIEIEKVGYLENKVVKEADVYVGEVSADEVR